MASRALPTQPYQGYPYIKPMVIDVPSVDAATASRWANLPRRPIGNPGPSVHVNMPRESGSGETSTDAASRLQETRESERKKEDAPVVYIDLPEQDSGQSNPAFVQDTILYDPFENRQIDLTRPKESPDSEDAPGTGPGRPPRPPTVARPAPSRPERPSNLHLPSGSAGHASTSPSLPGFMNQESQVYGSGSSEDGFSLTPLPVSEYPEPPPAYSEHDRNINSPPKTVVVVPSGNHAPTTVGQPSCNRKLVQCQNCRMRVHTLVVRENGPFTHFVALLTIILCFLPVTVVIYCTDFFKYQVHYCPNCNHNIGHEIPILCQSMVFSSQ